MRAATQHALAYCCPRCKGDLQSTESHYRCEACRRDYPVVLGLPDFRLFPDPYISIEDDHRKAGRLAEKSAAGASFADLVRFYWSITPDEPPEMAERFTAVAIAAAERGRHLLASQPEIRAALSAPRARVLDVGTRTGGLLLAAAERTPAAVGIDIAFRWLIVARKRLEEVGVEAQLCCCCAEHLPFRNGSFNLIVAENVLEHAAHQRELVAEVHRCLASEAVYFASTWNRLAPAPEPHVRLWGVGWLPLSWRRKYVRWRKSVSYDHVRLLSSGEVRRMFRSAAFSHVRLALPDFSAAELENVSPLQRRAVSVYHSVKAWPVLRRVLQLIAPVLHIVARK